VLSRCGALGGRLPQFVVGQCGDVSVADLAVEQLRHRATADPREGLAGTLLRRPPGQVTVGGDDQTINPLYQIVKRVYYSGGRH
jgi:hypothetical protein